MSVVGIEEATALIWQDGAWVTVGEGNVTAFRSGRRIEVADLPPLEVAPAIA